MYIFSHLYSFCLVLIGINHCFQIRKIQLRRLVGIGRIPAPTQELITQYYVAALYTERLDANVISQGGTSPLHTIYVCHSVYAGVHFEKHVLFFGRFDISTVQKTCLHKMDKLRLTINIWGIFYQKGWTIIAFSHGHGTFYGCVGIICLSMLELQLCF